MTTDIDQLWARALAGETLSAAEEEQLIAALGADEALRLRLLEEQSVAGMLREIGRQRRPADAEHFVGSFSHLLGAEGTGEMFVKAFQRRLPKPRFWTGWRLGLGGLVLAGAAAAIAVLWTPERVTVESPVAQNDRPAVTESTGDAFVQRGQSRTPLEPGVALEVGDRLETEVNASAVIRYPDAATVKLDGETRVALGGNDGTREGGGVELRVDRGRVTVDHHAPGTARPLVVTTPLALAFGRASRFSLAVRDGETRLDVASGTVRFVRVRDSSTEEVSAGRHALAVADAPPPPPPAPEPASRSARPLLSFDFESGDLPEGFFGGQLVEGPAHCRSRFALLGTLNLFYPRRLSVSVRRPVVFTYSPSTTLRFDYWLKDDEINEIHVHAESWKARRRHSMDLKNLVHGSWTRVELRLSEFTRERPEGQGTFAPGDQVDALVIMGGQTGKALFYIDNLAVLEHPDGQAPPTSTNPSPCKE